MQRKRRQYNLSWKMRIFEYDFIEIYKFLPGRVQLLQLIA